MSRTKINLAKILTASNKMTREQLYNAISTQKTLNKPLREILISKKFISEDELLSTLSYYFYIPVIDSSKFDVDPDLIKSIPEAVARKYPFLPLYKKGNLLLIVIAEPLDILTLDALHISLECEIKQVLGRERAILAALDECYSEAQPQSLPEILKYEKAMEVVRLKQKKDSSESADLIEESQKEPVVRAVDLIISEAIGKKASDIHLEPTEEDITIRYRIDGILHKVYSLPLTIQRGIAARIKILANLDITKFYLPQDGRFPLVLKGKEIDFRVSSLPTVFGEKFVLRILDKSGTMIKLDTLEFSQQPLGLVRDAMTRDHGMVLITGPTGSGKSTTLNAVLNELNTPERHIVTIEDPVEYQIEGIGQTQVKAEINLTFASALRGILRQSLDIIMIGEIRDAETADIAIKASLIGQLIFSTLHTNDAVSAFARLIDMGVERYLVASSLILVCAQRLCRRICANCREPIQSIPKYVLQDLGKEPVKDPKFFFGRGCGRCYQTGYKGRVAIVEALKVDDYLRSMVIKEVSFAQIKETMIKEGRLVPLRNDGLGKALDGVTTIEEIYRVTAKD